MFGKIIGAVLGSKLSESTRGVGGSGGAILGMGAVALAKRASLPLLVVLTAGGYFAKKHFDKKQAAEAKEPPHVAPAAV